MNEPDRGQRRQNSDVRSSNIRLSAALFGGLMVDQAGQDFLNLCSQANTLVDLAERKFSAWLSSVGSAYSEAWLTHTKFVTAIGTKAKLSQDILLGAALALIPGAIGGALGDVMKMTVDKTKDTWTGALARNKIPVIADVMIQLQLGTPTIDGIKDLAKWGLRSGAVVGTTSIGIPVGDVYKKFPTDPLIWQNDINERVQTELANITMLIESWQNAVNTNDNRFVPNFNPYEKVKDALKFVPKKYQPIGGPALTDITTLAPVNRPDVSKVFQAGFLTTWIDRCAWRASIEMSPVAWSGWGFGSRGVNGDIVDYGTRLDLQGIEKFISSCCSRDLEENNRRAIASGHGLI
jgi:hypothetical protein